MAIIIEIAFFLAVGATSIWAFIKKFSQDVSEGVKNKMVERNYKKVSSKYPLFSFANQFLEIEKKSLFGLLISLINYDIIGTRFPNDQEIELLNQISSAFSFPLNAVGYSDSFDDIKAIKSLARNDTIKGVSLFILSQMVVVDGNFTLSETEFITELLKALNLSFDEYQNILLTWGSKLDLNFI